MAVIAPLKHHTLAYPLLGPTRAFRIKTKLLNWAKSPSRLAPYFLSRSSSIFSLFTLWLSSGLHLFHTAWKTPACADALLWLHVPVPSGHSSPTINAICHLAKFNLPFLTEASFPLRSLLCPFLGWTRCPFWNH